MEILGERAHYQITISYRTPFFSARLQDPQGEGFCSRALLISVWAVLVDIPQKKKGDFCFQV